MSTKGRAAMYFEPRKPLSVDEVVFPGWKKGSGIFCPFHAW